jgi:hypothetical protein
VVVGKMAQISPAQVPLLVVLRLHLIMAVHLIMEMMGEVECCRTQVMLVAVAVVQGPLVAMRPQVAVDQAVQGAMVELIR